MENWNSIMDESNILKNVKKEPLQEIEIKTEYLENQYEESAENFESLASVWSYLVKRCRFLLKEENGYNKMNSYLLTKILIKEVNILLSEVVNFFQECCSPMNFDEKSDQDVFEVNGLLVNCVPCHPQNSTCYYKICSDIPETYLETLFSPLPGEIQDNEYYVPLAPIVEIDIKKETNIQKVKLVEK